MRGWMSGALAGALVLALGGCDASEPELDGGLAEDASAGADAGSDAGSGADGGLDAGPPPTGDSGTDAGSDAGPAPCELDFYRDGDGDGFGDPSDSVFVCSPPADYIRTGGDCDDSDPDAHPGQTMWFNVPRMSGGFDYDCDGSETLQRPDVGLCPDTSVDPPIPGTVGWRFEVAPCGAFRPWKNNAAVCGTTSELTQGCR